jgi:hypothetical protein
MMDFIIGFILLRTFYLAVNKIIALIHWPKSIEVREEELELNCTEDGDETVESSEEGSAKRELGLFILVNNQIRRYYPTKSERERVSSQVIHQRQKSLFYKRCFRRLSVGERELLVGILRRNRRAPNSLDVQNGGGSDVEQRQSSTGE